MTKNYILLIICVMPFIANVFGQTKNTKAVSLDAQFSIYSKSVQDSFVISIQLPDTYYKNTKTKYPTVYILDANFHFPMLASSIKQYEKGGLLPSVILIGIGYKSFKLMDSLRVRDYLFPAALPADEIKAIGGGQRFSDFINSQLIPLVDRNYRTETNNRSLLGHSLGGYFPLYCLLIQTEQNQNTFQNFAAASPPLWYNNFYLNQLPDKLRNRYSSEAVNVYLTVGGLEDSTWSISPVKKFAGEISSDSIKNMKFQCKVFSDLGHMDVATITFLKALQTFYKQPE